MSQELLNAAQAGDFETVERIVEANPSAINFIGRLAEGNNTYQYQDKKTYRHEFYNDFHSNAIETTPLRAAILENHPDIVFYLLEKGAKFEYEYDKASPDSKINLFHDVYPTALSMLSYYDCDPKILKKLLIISSDFNATMKNAYGVSQSTIKNLQEDYFAKKINYFLYEAICRNDLHAIDDVIQKNYQLVFDKEVMSNYLENRHLDIDFSKAPYIALFYLIEQQKMYSASEVMEVLLQHATLSEAELNLIHTPPTKTLDQLFMELQHLLYPEEQLPFVPIEQAIKMAIDTPSLQDKTIQEVKNRQSPKELREFLKLDPHFILERLCAYDPNGNAAAVLLAIISTYFANQEIRMTDDNNNEIERRPMLSNTEKEICKNILNQYYALTGFDRQALHSQFHAESKINQLIEENEGLKGEVNELKQEMDQLKRQFIVLSKKFNRNDNEVKKVNSLRNRFLG